MGVQASAHRYTSSHTQYTPQCIAGWRGAASGSGRRGRVADATLWRALFANPPAAECVGGCPCAQPRLPLVGRQENSERVVKRGASVQEVEARPSQAHVLRAGQGIGLRARQGETAHELRFSQGPRVARCPREQVGRSADGGAQGRPHASAPTAIAAAPSSSLSDSAASGLSSTPPPGGTAPSTSISKSPPVCDCVRGGGGLAFTDSPRRRLSERAPRAAAVAGWPCTAAAAASSSLTSPAPPASPSLSRSEPESEPNVTRVAMAAPPPLAPARARAYGRHGTGPCTQKLAAMPGADARALASRVR